MCSGTVQMKGVIYMKFINIDVGRFIIKWSFFHPILLLLLLQVHESGSVAYSFWHSWCFGRRMRPGKLIKT